MLVERGERRGSDELRGGGGCALMWEGAPLCNGSENEGVQWIGAYVAVTELRMEMLVLR